ncbi:hypothetical protein [Mycobacterium sp. NS-7484]|uniref:hypothetical protein n=1 Tax=Mycobacterium sp. NS-7484 TaxID=1834161 RepID=UPI00114ECD9B|nr:hypothetical protein [Mycobacterium sp. NS-7484]
MTKGLRVYPPSGYPHQGPQHNQPYPPQYSQPAYPPPMPPPPWQNLSAAPQSPTPGSKNMTKYTVIASGVFGAVFVMVAMFLIGGDTGGYFRNGDTVTPTADEHIVFVKEKHLDGKPASSVRCSATTDAGEAVSVSVPDEVLHTSRGARPTTDYVSVAELPTDQGPLTVTCTKGGAVDNYLDLVLGKPDSSTGVTIFFVGYVLLLIILVTVVRVLNRRYFRRYPRPPADGGRWQV